MEQDRERSLEVESGAGGPAPSRGGAGGAEPAPRAERPGADEVGALSTDELKAKLREAREESQRNWQQFLHSAADLENYKKQAARDRQDAVERTRRQMLSLVLNVVDNLERALAFGGAPDGPGKSLVDGLRMTTARSSASSKRSASGRSHPSASASTRGCTKRSPLCRSRRARPAERSPEKR